MRVGRRWSAPIVLRRKRDVGGAPAIIASRAWSHSLSLFACLLACSLASDNHRMCSFARITRREKNRGAAPTRQVANGVQGRRCRSNWKILTATMMMIISKLSSTSRAARDWRAPSWQRTVLRPKRIQKSLESRNLRALSFFFLVLGAGLSCFVARRKLSEIVQIDKTVHLRALVFARPSSLLRHSAGVQLDSVQLLNF